jgi:Tat protein translocase TatB subunit
VFLFILESIGTSELILIAIIALIFLGPRKLPQIAKTIGRTMADFRNTTNEFKSTWEREVNFEEEAHAIRSGELPNTEAAPIPRSIPLGDDSVHTLASPEIRPVQPEMFNNLPVRDEIEDETENHQNNVSEKKNWL